MRQWNHKGQTNEKILIFAGNNNEMVFVIQGGIHLKKSIVFNNASNDTILLQHCNLIKFF